MTVLDHLTTWSIMAVDMFREFVRAPIRAPAHLYKLARLVMSDGGGLSRGAEVPTIILLGGDGKQLDLRQESVASVKPLVLLFGSFT